MAEADPKPELSVVIPFFNEEDNVTLVISDVTSELNKLGKSWEAILVDDGSTDKTLTQLNKIAKEFTNITVIHFQQNLGQGASLFEGISLAKAPLIAMMDGDGQNLATDIGLLISQLKDNDLIVGIRVNRDDSKLRRLTSRIANFTRSRLLNDKLHDAGCALKVFRSEVRSSFYNIKMLNPFMPALAVAAHFKVAEYPVSHRARTKGKSKYGFRTMLVRPILDLLSVWLIIHSKRK
jgi:glycosyltransferase involved in cell wall biosynthesis